MDIFAVLVAVSMIYAILTFRINRVMPLHLRVMIAIPLLWLAIIYAWPMNPVERHVYVSGGLIALGLIIGTANILSGRRRYE